jgi:hypothetical protein
MAIVIVNTHEPDHEVATRLLELAEKKGHDARAVEAQRGEHDAALSFRVPDDVAEEFEKDRADRWPSEVKDDDEAAENRPVAALNEDAVAADNTRTATDAATTAAQTEGEGGDADEQLAAANARSRRPGKAQEKPKE